MKLYNVKIVAAMLNLSEKRVKQLTAQGVLTEVTKGHYDIKDSMQEYIKYLQNLVADDDVTSDYNTEKAKLTKAKRENEELELMIKKGNLHKSEDIELVVSTMLVAFRSKLLALPTFVASKVAGEDNESVVIEIINTEIYNVLKELQNYDELFKQ